MSSPKQNQAYEFTIALADSAVAGAFKANPTVASGDFQISVGNATYGTLAITPVIDPAGSVNVKINLSSDEMNDPKITIRGIDAAGDEWDDVFIFIDATTVNIEDIVRSTTPANTLDVNATGQAGIDFGNIDGILTKDFVSWVDDSEHVGLNLVDTSGVLGNDSVSWIDSNDRTNLGLWLDTAVTISSVTNKPEVDMFSISDEALPANNLQLQYNTTGLTGSTFPSFQDQLDNFAAGGGAPNTVAESRVLTTGIETLTFADTQTLDGITHDIADDGGVIDFYYEFDVTSTGTPTSIIWTGHAQSNGDVYNVFGWNWSGSSWDQIGTIDGKNGTATVEEIFLMTTAHVGTGGDEGKVRFRIQSTTGTEIFTDRVLCSFASALTVGEITSDIDANSLRLIAVSGDINELLTDWQDGGRLDLILDDVLADTNELQTDNIPVLISALNDVSISGIWDELTSSHTRVGGFGVAITDTLADTNELQTDWKNGGRLDVLIDAIKVPTDKMVFTTANKLNVRVDNWAGTATTISSTTALPEVDAKSISDDALAADNLELMYDGTGYVDPSAPSARSQVDSIGAASGGSVNIQCTEDNTGGAIIDGIIFVGSVQGGTFVSTEAEDGVVHDIDDVVNDIDIVYGFQIGGGRIGTSVSIVANVTGNVDEMKVKAYDHIGADWEIIGTVDGAGGSSFVTLDSALLLKHTGTGSELGKVYIRFDTDSTTPVTLEVDLLLVSAVSIGQTVGYANGRIFINTNASNINTESFVDGVADNPVSTIGAAKTLSTAIGLGDFHVINGSNITLSETTDNESYFGDNWILDLNGQSCAGSHFEGADVTGVQIGSNCGFHGGEMDTVTLADNAHLDDVGLGGTISLPSGSIEFFNCHHDGDSLPILDFGVAISSTTVHMHNYHGGVELQNLGDDGIDIVHLDGNGRLDLNVNCDGGTINLRGHWDINDSSNNNVTINYNDQSQGYEDGAIWIDTSGGTAGTDSHVNGVVDNPVNNIEDAVTLKGLTGIPDFHLFNGSSITLTASAANNSFFGDHWVLNLGSQACGGIYVQGATVSGAGTSSGDEMHFEGCDIGIASVQQGHFDKCGFNGTLTMTTADDYDFHNCYSKGDTVPVFTKTAGQIIIAEFQNYAGDITVSGLQTSDVIELGGNFRTITLSGTGGTVHVHGHYESISSGGFSGTLSITGATKFGDAADILVDTNELQTDNVPGLIAALNNLSPTDIISALEDAGQIMVQTTIATLATQISFTLAAGSVDSGAYEGAFAVIENASTPAQKAVGLIQTYTGGTKTILLRGDPGIFVMAIGDKISIIPVTPALPNGKAGSNFGLPVAGIQIPFAPANSAGGLPISIAGNLDLDTQLANTNEITVARMGALTDWINDGRLDTILDSILADTNELQADNIPSLISNLNDVSISGIWDELTSSHTRVGGFGQAITDILTDTNELQGDDVPTLISNLNNISTTEVKTETDQSLVDFFVSSVQLVDDVWDELTVGHVTVGSFGVSVTDILADTNELQGDDVPGLIAGLNDLTQAEVTGGAYALNTDVNGSIRIVDGTGTGEINTSSGAIVQVDQLGTQAKSDINAEVVDVMNVDLITLPGQVTPPSNPTRTQMQAHLYKSWLFKVDQSSTLQRLYASDGSTIDQQRTVGEAGSIVTLGPITTGP